MKGFVLSTCLVRKRSVVLLQRARGVKVGRRERDGGVGLARLRVGGVVDAGDADAEGNGEGVLLRRDGHLVQDNRLQVALGLGGALEVRELLLYT